MATPVNFWKFKVPSNTQYNNTNHLPEIVPNTGGGAIKAAPGGSRRVSEKVLPMDALTGARTSSMDVNIVSDFYWTNHGTNARMNVPKIRLVEKKLLVSAYVSNMLLAIKNASETAKEGVGKLASVGESTLGMMTGDNLSDTLSGSLQRSLDVLRKKMNTNGVNAELGSELINSEYLNSYNGIYLVKSTGFSYTFPLEFGEQVGISNRFDSTAGKGGSTSPEKSDQKESFTDKAAKLDGGIQMLADMAAKTKNLTEPGTYFERAKEFGLNVDSDAQQWNVSFPLSNTGAYDSMLQNINFVYMFRYQNTPGRRTRSIIDPPCIYEVFVEGVSYVPYAFITNLKIEFLGKVSDEIVDLGGKEVRMPVPEAYNVSFTVVALNPKTRNMMMAGLESNVFTNASDNMRMTDFLFDANRK